LQLLTSETDAALKQPAMPPMYISAPLCASMSPLAAQSDNVVSKLLPYEPIMPPMYSFDELSLGALIFAFRSNSHDSSESFTPVVPAAPETQAPTIPPEYV
jgi:hypothetical protein